VQPVELALELVRVLVQALEQVRVLVQALRKRPINLQS